MEIKKWLFVFAALTLSLSADSGFVAFRDYEEDWHGEPLGTIPGVQSIQTIIVPEEIDLRTCQEGAAEPRTLHQTLEVDVTFGKEIKKIAHCLGHEEEVDGGKEILWFEHKKTAQELKNKKVEQLKTDPAIADAKGSIHEKKATTAQKCNTGITTTVPNVVVLISLIRFRKDLRKAKTSISSVAQVMKESK